MLLVAVWLHERCSRKLPPASAHGTPPSSLIRDDGGEGQAGAERGGGTRSCLPSDAIVHVAAHEQAASSDPQW
jgi:hypothetical protein